VSNRINPVTYRLALLAGVRRSAILRAPDALNHAATTGAVMLLTATIATLTMGYALDRSFEGDSFALQVAFGGGLLWGAFILTLDRLLLMGIDKTGRWYHTAIQLLIRLPIAVLLGFAISKPVVLRLSRTILDLDLRDQQVAAVAADRSRYETEQDLPGKASSVEILKKQRTDQERRIGMEPDSFDYKNARADVQSANSRYNAIIAANGPRIANAQRQLRAVEGSPTPEDIRRAQALRASISRWRSEIVSASQAVTAAKDRLAEVRDEWTAAEKAKLDRINRDLDAAIRARDNAKGIIDTDTRKSDATLQELMRTNLINEYAAMEHIKNTPSHRHARTVKRFEGALDAIFILFELTPLLSKAFSRTNALDREAAAVELEDENRIYHAVNTKLAQAQKLFEVAVTLYDDAADQWAESKRQELQQNPTLTAKALEELREEIARLAA